MATILDSAIAVLKETSYGVPPTAAPAVHSSAWRSIEGQADTWKRSQEYLESVGMRGAMQATPTDRRKVIQMGAEGSLEFDVGSRGLVRLMDGMLGNPATSSLYSSGGGVSGYKWTIQTAASAQPTASYAIEVQRPDINGTMQYFRHLGSVITEWSLKNDMGGLLNCSAKFDATEVTTSASTSCSAINLSVPTPTGTGTSAANDIYDWTQAVITWNGQPIDTKSFAFDVKLSLKTDRRFLRNSFRKKAPLRNAVPEYTGTIEIDYDTSGGVGSSGVYADFAAGTPRTVTATWYGSSGVSGGMGSTPASACRQLVLTLQNCQLSGGDPEVSLSDTPKQSLPFKVLWDPAVATSVVQLDYYTPDNAA